MTYEEAEEKLWKKCDQCDNFYEENEECLGSKECFEFLAFTTGALNKQIPKKWIKKNDSLYSPFETRSDGYVYICPMCNNDTRGIKSLYCSFCGQRLE